MNMVYIILLVITFDAFLFLNNQKKFKGYVTLKHYAETLKMPIYQLTLMMKELGTKNVELWHQERWNKLFLKKKNLKTLQI